MGCAVNRVPEEICRLPPFRAKRGFLFKKLELVLELIVVRK